MEGFSRQTLRHLLAREHSARLAAALIGCLALNLGGATLSFARDENPPERTFFEPVEVSVVNVEVLVTDTTGRPVPVLTSNDFEIFEAGRTPPNGRDDLFSPPLKKKKKK